jgi:hypothetical protein
MSDNEFQILGKFASPEEAALAVSVEEALLDPDGEDVVWRRPPILTCEPAEGHCYEVGENLTPDDPFYRAPRPPWYAMYRGPGEAQATTWQRDFDTKEAAQQACDDDWKERSGE